VALPEEVAAALEELVRGFAVVRLVHGPILARTTESVA
jgi:hypothetical protein